MQNSVLPLYPDMWEPKQHTTLAKYSAKKHIRSADKAASLGEMTPIPVPDMNRMVVEVVTSCYHQSNHKT
jgi:hypothetical protein